MKILYASLPLAGLLAVSACSGGGTDGAAPASAQETTGAAEDTGSDDGVRVLQPGGPGDPTREGPVDVEDNEHNEADVYYMTMMVPHHRQALVMSDLATTRAEDPRVRRIASRIRAAQAPEIQYMSTWLTDQGEPVPAPEDDTVDGHGAHGDHAEMGMLDAEQLRALVDAEGEEFDRLYLEGMIGHHEGAISMSEDVTVEGTDIDVSMLAADVNVGQVGEINRMQDILDSL